MDPLMRASKLDEAFEFINRHARPTPSHVIGARVLDLRLRDRREVRRVVRRLLSQDNRFQEVNAGHWEALNHDYGRQRLDDAEFRVLDLEVTGSDPKHNGIIDLAVFAVRGGRVQPLLATLVDPEVPIPGNIQRLTGIDSTMVRGAPTFAEILPQLLDVLQGGVFVAHNAAFDYHFLKTCIERLTGQRFTAPHVCTVKLSQRLIEPKNSRKLHHLALQLGIPLQNRHRAYDDAFATAHILVEILHLLHDRRIATVGEMKLFESSLIAVDKPAADKPGGGNGAHAAEPPAA